MVGGIGGSEVVGVESFTYGFDITVDFLQVILILILMLLIVKITERNECNDIEYESDL